MYQQPKLEFYGTLRELTQVGTGTPVDAVFVNGVPGNPGGGPFNEFCDQVGTNPPTNCHFS